MELAVYQIIVPIVAFVFICKAFSLYFTGRKTLREMISWVLVWGGIALVAIFPDSIGVLTQYLGIKSSINAVIFLALGALFYAVFRLVVMVEDHEYDMTRLTRYHALREVFGEHTLRTVDKSSVRRPKKIPRNK